MNYVLRQINRKIQFLKSTNKKIELKPHYQSKLEFYLNIILGYLWNKNWENISDENREYILNCILKPSVGSIISIIRTLDISKEIYGNKKNKKVYAALEKYPKLRNQIIGHGYSFEDDIDNYLSSFEELFEAIENADIDIIKNDFDIVYVEEERNGIYHGVSYKSDGVDYINWQCSKETCNLICKSLYIHNNDNYSRISPFVLIKDESSIYTFCSIEEKLTGRAKYNRIITTGNIQIEVGEFCSTIINDDGVKRKNANGTIINNFTNNYKKYIDVGISSITQDFLTKNKASVFATLWGHGGVGKTASIQYVCDLLCKSEEKKFDYIIFLSAKDRYYNYYRGRIEKLDDNISSLNQIVESVNKIIYNIPSFDVEKIYEFEGKLLLIFDDFETFSKDEKKNITEFISQLNINHHKVVITTRSATLITGVEIQTSELNIGATINFFIDALKNEFPEFNISLIEKDLENEEFREKIFQITSGRPLFILQLVVLLVQKSDLREVIKNDIKTSEEAKNFLYNRIYDYLSLVGKNMFLAIGLLADENELSGLTENLRFILNLEDKEDEFQKAINELIKLKIITVEDKDFFKIYSQDIYKYMKSYYQNKGEQYDGNITSRFNTIAQRKDRKTELALLESADGSRMIATESEVENKYRFLINRDKTSETTKIKAILNFASYLSMNGKYDKTIKLFEDYYHMFGRVYSYIYAYSKYLWAEGSSENKQESISIIKIYFETKPRIETDQYLDLLGILTMYMSVYAINEKDEYKEMLTFGDITKEHYKQFCKNQRQTFSEILRYPGGHLYKSVKDLNLMDLSPSCRNSVLNGLTHFVEVCIRLNKFTYGIEICDKMINDMPENLQKPFIHKKNKIESFINPSPALEAPSNVPQSDIGIKLK